MGQAQRAGHMDVSNTVDVTDPRTVGVAVREILEGCHCEYDFAALGMLVEDFDRLYSGQFPGFHACDIKYHDTQHVLDVTLAMARLLDGHERTHPDAALGPELCLAGVAAALFHDSGYIRRVRDSRNRNGAAYTRVHVERSARFLADYLIQVGLEHLVGACTSAVRYTSPDLGGMPFGAAGPAQHRLGTLLGTADLIAQIADAEYLRKCREHLYEEFVAGGLAGSGGVDARGGVIYESPDHLLQATPDFIRRAIRERLGDSFEGVYRYAEVHFGGRNLYMESIRRNSDALEALLSGGSAAAACP